MELLTFHVNWLMLIVSFLISVFWVIALVSILKSDFKDSTAKLIWILIVSFLPAIGSILYLIIGRNQRINKN